VFGFVASYARMAWKVANYNALKREADGLRVRYQSLQQVVSQTNEQLASLQLYAKEVSVAYGIKQKLEGPADISAEGKLVPTFAESVQDYDFLRSTNLLALPAAIPAGCGHRAHSRACGRCRPHYGTVRQAVGPVFGGRRVPQGSGHQRSQRHTGTTSPRTAW